MKKIALKDGITYSASIQSIFDGSAFDVMKSELITLKERVQQSVGHMIQMILRNCLMNYKKKLTIWVLGLNIHMMSSHLMQQRKLITMSHISRMQ